VADYSIWVLEYGYVDKFPVSNLLAAQPNEGRRRMPYCFGLVRSARHCILVDTGFTDPAAQRRITDKYGVTYWSSPIAVLERAGVSATEVDMVLLTHNHFDHAGCVADFPSAHVFIQRREMTSYEEALALPRRFEFLTRSCEQTLPDILGKRAREQRLTWADGDLAVLDGIDLRPAFDTHTAGSQFVLVDNAADGRWLFAGDNVYTYQNIEGLRGDGVLEPIGTSTGSQAVWLASIDEALSWVGRESRRVLPFHESELWTRVPSHEYSDGLHVAEISLAGGHDTILPSAELPSSDSQEGTTK
jgi:glyoxylase-like metal-dependent hydrolase (beta-lactamase superfamily II)